MTGDEGAHLTSDGLAKIGKYKSINDSARFIG